ncbi:NAD(P)-dependent oxidoreductase, partial [Nostocoides jenkinsii]|uniref:NAD(P)-dependent oxidoreductase n=1 Tax=Nostocoides jenkinsii TaxID=330834 RepID=UPI00065BA5DB
MSQPDYPITLDVTGRRVLVVGAGPVAERRIRRLLNSAALVDVVAPTATEGIAALADSGSLRWREREFEIEDLVSPRRAWLVHAATGIAGVDDLVGNTAAAEAIWCVRAGDSAKSAAWMPAVGVGRGAADGVQVAVTGGADPPRAPA